MKIAVIVLALLLLGGGAFLYFKRTSTNSSLRNQVSDTKNYEDYRFMDPKKSAHYESNTPAHESVLAGIPVNVVIDFNFDLHDSSNITITHNGVDYSEGPVIVDANKLSMRRSIKKDSPNGVYTVTYDACWPDKSCHDGLFQFIVDRNKATGFTDMTGKSDIKISMKNLMFEPVKTKISKGTKVTWVNDDPDDHYVNTDSHPAHTYFLTQNSKLLKTGDEYSVTFDEVGIYPYHCSLHEASMKATILVE